MELSVKTYLVELDGLLNPSESIWVKEQLPNL
jgi:hypothetical protein